ncbi:type VII secretion protein EccE [Amycolatopsis halotolerans]|uniref:Type VII secretion protein EccE n=1 Tax=Amycolatopsis halotolerans TaxID=330083 RepID=A0ABV7QEQ2_9PSEU
MTHPGEAHPGRRASAPARGVPEPTPLARPIGQGQQIPVPADAQAAARTAALAALTAARAAAPSPVATYAQPWRPVVTTPPPTPVRLPTERRRRWGALQVVCWQLVLVAAVLAIGRPWPVAATIGLGAVALLTLTSLRYRGRWGYEWLSLSLGYALRDRERELADADETGRALLRTLSPEGSGHPGQLGDDPVFLFSRTDGISAVLRPNSLPPTPIPGPEALLPPAEPGTGFVAQVLYHTGVDRQQPPRIWLALQALRTVERYEDDAVRQALTNALRRVQRRLRRDGVPTTPLGEPEFLGSLASLAHVTAGRTQVREQWRLWHSGSVSQTAFRLDGWSDLPPATTPRLIHAVLGATSQTAVTLSLTARRSGGVPEVVAVVRVASPHAATVERAGEVLARLAGEWGLRLDRLEGRQHDGLTATLPLGAVC